MGETSDYEITFVQKNKPSIAWIFDNRLEAKSIFEQVQFVIKSKKDE